MKQTPHYYVLRYERTDALHKAGDHLINAEGTLHIGQTEECEVRLPNDSQYEDALLAIIKKNQDGEGWILVRISPYREQEIRVNGMPIDYAHPLASGDRIAFEGIRQELLFTIHNDNHYAATSGIMMVQKQTPRSLIGMVAVAALLLVAGLFMLSEHSLAGDQLTSDMIDEARQSVFQLRVDSVSLISLSPQGDTTILGTCPYNAMGTAFLTTDSLLVTARHCVEPWLNVPDSAWSGDTAHMEPLPVRWAVQAETHNQLALDSNQWLVVSHFTIMRRDTASLLMCSLKSTDVKINKSRDEVIEMGDFEHLYFWRSIKLRAHRTDVMLGDAAYVPMTTAMLPCPRGTIKLATRKEIATLCAKSNKALAILGFPENENVGARDAECSKDELRQPLTRYDDGYPITVLEHNGQIVPGNSGGPVLMRDGSNYYAVGIISVLDKKNRNRSYSVPVTEIERMRNHPNLP